MTTAHENSAAGGPNPAKVVADGQMRDGALVLAVTGEVDLDAAQELSRALEGGLEGPASCVVADFSRVTFCDSTGLNVLLRAHHGGDLRIAGPPPSVTRLLELTGADAVLRVYPDVATAVAGG
ncbi:STAS domain-containing protein [Streptomyces chumphonensis]|uniref:STAS domain-containing protein n=1 Tax=Streptomyces chumphonensis TaxID=1214925 RepID=UPI003D725296